MSPIERHIRLTSIAERIGDIEGELIVIANETEDHDEERCLEHALRELTRLQKSLHAVATNVSLETALLRSIDYVQAQKRCEEVGR